MKLRIITWNPSKTLRARAVKIAELKKTLTYTEVAKIFPYSLRYIQELNCLGQLLEKEKSEVES